MLSGVVLTPDGVWDSNSRKDPFGMNRFRRVFFQTTVIALLAAPLAARPMMPASALSASPTVLTFTPDADGYVAQANPSANYGKAADLRVRTTPAMRSYLRFTVSGLGGLAIANARLQVYANTGSPAGLRARAVPADNWGENTLTFSNAPALGGALAASSAVAADTWVNLNVTSYVKSTGTYSFALISPTVTPISLASREAGAKAPRLVITLDSWQPSFPIRAAFYYPWFPEAWKQKGIFPYTNYTPSLSYYSSKDANVLAQHLAMMEYANIDAGIASWWGQGSQTDSKIPGLLNAASGSHFRWALYYENESQGDPSSSQIHNDLAYIRDRYGKNPAFLRVNGKFVVFVYSAGNDGCGMVTRWKQANTVGAYVVLKVFPGYRNCPGQPNSWHQYSPAVASSQQSNFSYSVSPGFWLKGQSVRLTRDAARWTQNVKDMAASGVKWQLITTFSEWGEGTAVETAAQWQSASGYGQYLDALHDNP
jgi:hypothetical protein